MGLKNIIVQDPQQANFKKKDQLHELILWSDPFSGTLSDSNKDDIRAWKCH